MREHGPLWRAAAAGRPWAGRLAGSVGLSVVTVGAGVALMATSGYLISRAAQMPPILTLTLAIVGVRFFAILRAVSRYLERLASHDAALRVVVEMRVRLLRRLIPLVPGGLPLRRGDLLSRAVADVDRLQHLFVRALSPPVVAVVVVAGTAAAAALMLPAAGAVLLTALVVTAVAVPLVSVAVSRRANARQAAARGALAAEVAEVVAASSELVVNGAGPAQAERVAAADRALQRLVRRDALATAAADALGAMAAGLAAVAVLVVAIPAVGEGRLAGVLLASLVLMGLAAFEAVNGLPAAAQGMTTSAAAARRLEEVAPEGTPPVVVTGEASAPGPLRLEARNLTVAPAAGAEPAVRGLDLDLRPGERVALVGPSGCGKSTLLRALSGLLPATGGTLALDGRDARDLDPASVRDRVRLCGQDAHLFATSVAENVRLARPGSGDAAVRDALGRVGLGSWIETLPEGMATYAGDDGARVSGGQRQRIGLARGLLAAPDLLLVDEPTSHLDAAAARAFLDDLLSLDAGVGVLMTTHRLEGLDRFDRVLVMRDGRIVQDGPAPALAAQDGPYARMLAAAVRVEGAIA